MQAAIEEKKYVVIAQQKWNTLSAQMEREEVDYAAGVVYVFYLYFSLFCSRASLPFCYISHTVNPSEP